MKGFHAGSTSAIKSLPASLLGLHLVELELLGSSPQKEFGDLVQLWLQLSLNSLPAPCHGKHLNVKHVLGHLCMQSAQQCSL